MDKLEKLKRMLTTLIGTRVTSIALDVYEDWSVLRVSTEKGYIEVEGPPFIVTVEVKEDEGGAS